MIGIIKSLGVTFKHMFMKKFTVQYPEQKLIHSDRYRGVHILEKDLCIGCKNCQTFCPDTSNCITLEVEKDPYTTRKIPTIFKIDMNICCFCGICTEVCPTNCIQMTSEAEFATMEKGETQNDLLHPSPRFLAKKHEHSIHNGMSREVVMKERKEGKITEQKNKKQASWKVFG